MWRYAIIALAMAIIATQAPTYLEQASKQKQSAARVQPEKSSRPRVTRVGIDSPRGANPLEGRTARISSDRRGHFVTPARLNGRRVTVLVDTGATAVAINRSTARRIGIRLSGSDFKYRVSTANGVAMAASATIKEVQIGRVIVRNVRATVMQDKALNTVLLGMTFLNELRKFEVSSGTLVLTQ